MSIIHSPAAEYRRHLRRKTLILVSLLALTLLFALLSLSVGASRLSLSETLRGLFGIGDARVTVQNIRLPRVLAALIAGVALALSGTLMQTVLGNPMASPSTLGVSQAAVLGANFAITVLGAGAFHSTHGDTVSIQSPLAVGTCAFLCALGAVLLILLLSARRGFSPETVVLCGVAFGSLCSAGTTVLQFFSMDTQVAAAVFWTFGDLGRAGWRDIFTLLAVTVPSVLWAFARRWDFNALSGGEESAAVLGVRVRRVRFMALLLSSLLCAATVSSLGIIGFVGLAAPQLMKRVLGEDHRYLLPAAALAGASLLLFSDVLARTLLAGISLPVGAITSLIGGPILLWLLTGKGGKR